MMLGQGGQAAVSAFTGQLHTFCLISTVSDASGGCLVTGNHIMSMLGQDGQAAAPTPPPHPSGAEAGLTLHP